MNTLFIEHSKIFSELTKINNIRNKINNKLIS